MFPYRAILKRQMHSDSYSLKKRSIKVIKRSYSTGQDTGITAGLRHLQTVPARADCSFNHKDGETLCEQ